MLSAHKTCRRRHQPRSGLSAARPAWPGVGCRSTPPKGQAALQMPEVALCEPVSDGQRGGFIPVQIIHVGRLKRVGDAVIHLISRSAICWTTLPLALIRQPPSPIGTAISILSLSVAQPANPFHPPGGTRRGCVPLAPCPFAARAACTRGIVLPLKWYGTTVWPVRRQDGLCPT